MQLKGAHLYLQQGGHAMQAISFQRVGKIAKRVGNVTHKSGSLDSLSGYIFWRIFSGSAGSPGVSPSYVPDKVLFIR